MIKITVSSNLSDEGARDQVARRILEALLHDRTLTIDYMRNRTKHTFGADKPTTVQIRQRTIR